MDIQGCVISNLRRSPNATFPSKFVLHTSTTGAQLAELRTRVNGYIRSKSLDWKPTVGMSIAYGDPNRLEVSEKIPGLR